MPSKLTATLFIIVVLLIGGWYMVARVNPGSFGLVVPSLSGAYQQTPSPSPVYEPAQPAYNPPKDFKFDSSTDLKQELEKVNPQVLDSDFE